MKRNRWIAIGFVLVVALLVGVNLVRLRAKPAAAGGGSGPKNAPAVKVAKLAPRDLTLTVIGPATVEAGGPQEVRAPFTTESATLLVTEGETVKSGQVIARLADQEYALRVLGQETMVGRARLAVQNLQEQGALAQQQAAQKVAAAQAQLAQAEEAIAAVSDRSGSTQSRLVAAQAAMRALQTRAGESNAAVGAARLRVELANAQLQADPQNAGLRKAYQEAESAYQVAAESANKAAESLAAELVQVEESLRTAEREADAANKPDSGTALQAQSGVEAAKLVLTAAQRELATGGTLAAQTRLAELDLQTAQATLIEMQGRLAQAEVKAPTDGTVLAIAVKGAQGQPIQQGQSLLTLGNLAAVTVRVRVDEVDISKVKVGLAVTLRANGAPGKTFDGKVTTVAAQATGQQGQAPAYEVQAVVQNPDRLLRSGMSAEVEITADGRTAVLVIGLQALREDGKGFVVPVVTDFKVRLVPVTVGLRTSSEAEVTAGLTPGDQVIISPFTLIRSVKEGEPVRIEAGEAKP